MLNLQILNGNIFIVVLHNHNDINNNNTDTYINTYTNGGVHVV